MNNFIINRATNITNPDLQRQFIIAGKHNYNNAAVIYDDCSEKIDKELSQYTLNPKKKEVSNGNNPDEYRRRQTSIERIAKYFKNAKAAQLAMRSSFKLLFKTNIKNERLKLREIVDDCINGIYNSDTYPDITVNNMIPRISYVSSDKDLVKQTIHTLIQNALEELAINKSKDKDQKSEINIRVKKGKDKIDIIVEDSGKGIDKDTQKIMFDEDQTTKPMYKNQGSGLPSALEFAKAIKGALYYQENPKAFILSLPIPEKQSTVSNVKKISEIDKKPSLPNQILLCDDEPMVLRALNALLTSYNVENKLPTQVQTFPNTESLIKYVDESFTDTEKPELIIIDSTLRKTSSEIEVISAKKFMEQIQAIWANKQNVPLPKIIILSGEGLGESLEEETKQNHPNYLGRIAKPIPKEEFIKVYEMYAASHKKVPTATVDNY